MELLLRPRVAARIVAQDHDYCLAVWQQTVFTVFSGPPTLEHVKSISAQCLKSIRERRGGVTYLSVIERGSPAPSEPVRHELAAWSRDIVTKLSIAVMVSEGGGFRGALVRGVGVALTVLLPHKVPFKFATSVDEGAGLLAPFLAESSGGIKELLLAIGQVRAERARSGPANG